MQKLLINSFCCASIILFACSVHRLDIQQGNVATKELLQKLKIGMDKNQVRYVMGTALVQDPFHPGRWDYVFSYKPHQGQRTLGHITVHFEQDNVVRIESFLDENMDKFAPKSKP